MFDFVRKSQIWNALDNGRLAELDSKISFQLKTMQDLAVYEMLRDHRGSKIAEIGGGNSRILRRLAQTNQCYNIEKFEGIDGGPKGEINIPGVTNVDAYVGDFDGALEADSFDVAFSVSVVEHVVEVTPDRGRREVELLCESCRRGGPELEDRARDPLPGGSVRRVLRTGVRGGPHDFHTTSVPIMEEAVQVRLP